jgi:hypothetical protein
MTRRLRWLVVGVAALVAVGGALFHFDRSTGSMPPRTASPPHALEIGEQNGGVAYGDTAKQVVAKLGPPTRQRAACWVYSAGGHTIHGEYLGKWIDALKFCFADGPVGGRVVATIYEHILPTAPLSETEYPPGGWIHAFNIAAPASEQLKV